MLKKVFVLLTLHCTLAAAIENFQWSEPDLDVSPLKLRQDNDINVASGRAAQPGENLLDRPLAAIVPVAANTRPVAPFPPAAFPVKTAPNLPAGLPVSRANVVPPQIPVDFKGSPIQQPADNPLSLSRNSPTEFGNNGNAMPQDIASSGRRPSLPSSPIQPIPSNIQSVASMPSTLPHSSVNMPASIPDNSVLGDKTSYVTDAQPFKNDSFANHSATFQKTLKPVVQPFRTMATAQTKTQRTSKNKPPTRKQISVPSTTKKALKTRTTTTRRLTTKHSAVSPSTGKKKPMPVFSPVITRKPAATKKTTVATPRPPCAYPVAWPLKGQGNPPAVSLNCDKYPDAYRNEEDTCTKEKGFENTDTKLYIPFCCRKWQKLGCFTRSLNK
ncbi:proline-rich protein 36-like [Paramacrobiotus metropolitanus]|uniref:proline-rich protein 36-like n=1 Tax=Paramacrobiotus metropolitanus TaxID=2943436 RepID=UPI0024456FDC|nr:proline-rich protein 36-like [Paramacrobiotus metropolitanus]